MGFFKKFLHGKMQRQIILITCAAFLIPEVLILTISELFFVKHIRERYDVLIEAEETRVSSVMFDMTFTAYNVCQDLTYDAGVISFFKRKTPASDSATLEKSLLIKAAKDRLPMLLSMTVYTDNSNIGSQGNIIHLDDLAGEDWYRKSDCGQWSSWIISDVRMNRVYTQPCLTLVQKINTLGADTEAYLVAVVSYDYMKNRLGTSGYSLMMTTGPEESFYATEHQNIGAVLPWHDFDGTTYARYHGLTGEGKNRKLTYLNAFTPFATKSKIYIQVIDPDAVHNIRVLQGTFIMITVLAIVMPFLMILIATGELDRRVSQLRNSMHRISLGDYEIMGQFSGDDELTDIFRDLKTTADNIREREKAYYQEIIQNQQLTNRQQQIEYKMLESQINPHYLYNTLEMIRMQALSHRDIAVGNSVLMLSRTMHYVLESYHRRFVTLSEELEHVTNYLRIQKLRFDDRVNWDFYIDEGVHADQYRILPLLLQPIVENAVTHGLESKTHEGHISVIAEAIGEEVHLTVIDNGNGMDETQLQKTIRRMDDRHWEESGHIGLKNTNQRIKLFYGEQYGLRVTSELGIGTQIMMILPANPPGKEEQDASKTNTGIDRR